MSMQHPHVKVIPNMYRSFIVKYNDINCLYNLQYNHLKNITEPTKNENKILPGKTAADGLELLE